MAMATKKSVRTRETQTGGLLDETNTPDESVDCGRW